VPAAIATKTTIDRSNIAPSWRAKFTALRWRLVARDGSRTTTV
jgi:hypothetical protein